VESAPEFFSATQEGLPVALHVRALPVHDRLKAAPLALLAGVAGALYAAPCGPHGASFRKWDHVETDGLALDKPPFAVVLETDAAYSVDIACDIRTALPPSQTLSSQNPPQLLHADTGWFHHARPIALSCDSAGLHVR
jgi:hypothetical protein